MGFIRLIFVEIKGNKVALLHYFTQLRFLNKIVVYDNVRF